MVNERVLLEKLIRDQLGDGDVHFEKNVGEGKRIDLLYIEEDVFWIIEAKEKLNHKAIGQVISYKALFDKEKKDYSRDVKLGIVCFETDSDLVKVCRDKNIEVFSTGIRPVKDEDIEEKRDMSQHDKLREVMRVIEKWGEDGGVPIDIVKENVEDISEDFVDEVIEQEVKNGRLSFPQDDWVEKA